MKREFKILISFVLVIFNLINPCEYSNIIYIVAYLFVGFNVIVRAIRNLFSKNLFDENFLMSIATIGAFFVGEFIEAVAVMLFYQVGELFENYATDKSRKSISDLMDIRPDYANLIVREEEKRVSPEDVNVNDLIIVKIGEKIPLDGIVVDGSSYLNTKSLTGESVLRKVEVNDEVFSGCINENSFLKIKVTKKFYESTVSKILELVEDASSRKSKSEMFITKFSRYYTPIVVLLAVILGLIVPLVFNQSFDEWIYRSLLFLVVSCPCALVISVPLTFFGGLGAASKNGVLIKGSSYLEALSKTTTIVCDKTGTLTKGEFLVQEINSKIREDELLRYVSYAEVFSNHPIANSLKQAYGKKIIKSKVTDVLEISGKGIKANVFGKKVLVGNDKLMKDNKIDYEKVDKVGTILYVSIDNEFVGSIIISDKIKDSSYNAIRELRNLNVKKIIMLSGDKEDICKSISDDLKLDSYECELLPQDKVKKVEELLEADKSTLVFIGDGINDAPVLALSDVGISMGAMGSDAAIEASDVVIMDDDLLKVSKCIKISKKTMRIVYQNIIFAIFVKLFVLVLSAIGIATMWEAVFADVGVTVIATINALRILRK